MKFRNHLAKLAAYLVILGVLSLATLAPAVQAASSHYTFKPVADAYVSVDAPDTNFGANQSLRVDASPTVHSFLRFEVSELRGAVTSAKLRILANSASGSGFAVNTVSDTSWDENAIVWSNAPQIDGLVNESGPVKSGGWVSVDVTSAVLGNGPVSLALTTQSETNLNLAAREEGSGSAPQLVIFTSPDPGTEPSPTQPPVGTATSTQTPAGTATSTQTPSGTVTPTQTPAGTATPTIVPTQPPPTQPPPTGGDAVLVGAGDISVCGSTGDDQTAALLNGISGTIFTAGDNAYDSGTASQFNDCFNPSWGQFKDRIRPAAGNHDYLTSGASGYYNYFGSAAGPSGEGYYSYNAGSWHIVVLNSNCSSVGGCGAGSAQENWLRADLAANPAQCTAAYWHHPRLQLGLRARQQHRSPAALAGALR